MAASHPHQFPKLHNAAWPGVVGKGSEDGEPCLPLAQMLDLTAAAVVDGRRFDGVDLFLFAPHVDIDASDDAIEELAEQVRSRDLLVGSVVAPVWPPTGGGSAMGDEIERERFLAQVMQACRIAQGLRQLGIRPYGVVRVDSACSPSDWAIDPEANQAKIADTFRRACDIAESYDECLAAEGEICWGGMHSWRKMLDSLQRVNRPDRLGFQADLAHTLMYLLGYNAPEDALLPADFDWSHETARRSAWRQLADALRPWTIDFHVAQNDATVYGSGSHDKTGRHCLPDDPAGKLQITQDAGFWLRDAEGQLTKRFQHICWDGCMFPNQVMLLSSTWEKVLGVMLDVQDAHGWSSG